ncbi:uncharacterized protein LOC134686250 isoform X2 [Mytilus trossulus]|uniref:uncharacterized protein LOC134686250 isoform X2 n=1 Tax=Mytilus trossulus TaxID=6551 RepID=UPI0030040E60
MSTSLQKTPEIIQHVQRMNKITIKPNLASEYNHIKGIYTIEYDNTDGEEVITVTESEPTSDGMLLIDGERERQNCVRDNLTVFSPAGFQLGSVVRRRFDLYSQYDICDGNMKMLYHLKSDSSETFIMNQGNKVVATVSHDTKKTTFEISYQLETSTIEKFLILICVLMWTKHVQLHNEGQEDYCCRMILRQLTLCLISCIPT